MPEDNEDDLGPLDLSEFEFDVRWFRVPGRFDNQKENMIYVNVIDVLMCLGEPERLRTALNELVEADARGTLQGSYRGVL